MACYQMLLDDHSKFIFKILLLLQDLYSSEYTKLTDQNQQKSGCQNSDTQGERC